MLLGSYGSDEGRDNYNRLIAGWIVEVTDCPRPRSAPTAAGDEDEESAGI